MRAPDRLSPHVRRVPTGSRWVCCTTGQPRAFEVPSLVAVAFECREPFLEVGQARAQFHVFSLEFLVLTLNRCQGHTLGVDARGVPIRTLQTKRRLETIPRAERHAGLRTTLGGVTQTARGFRAGAATPSISSWPPRPGGLLLVDAQHRPGGLVQPQQVSV